MQKTHKFTPDSSFLCPSIRRIRAFFTFSLRLSSHFLHLCGTASYSFRFSLKWCPKLYCHPSLSQENLTIFFATVPSSRLKFNEFPTSPYFSLTSLKIRFIPSAQLNRPSNHASNRALCSSFTCLSHVKIWQFPSRLFLPIRLNYTNLPFFSSSPPTFLKYPSILQHSPIKHAILHRMALFTFRSTVSFLQKPEHFRRDGSFTSLDIQQILLPPYLCFFSQIRFILSSKLNIPLNPTSNGSFHSSFKCLFHA